MRGDKHESKDTAQPEQNGSESFSADASATFAGMLTISLAMAGAA
jgi:hypothetical protein